MNDPDSLGQALQEIPSRPAASASDENFSLLVENYQYKLRRFFAKQGFSVESAEELTQEVFLRVFTGRENFRAGASVAAFSAWLFQIARNIARDTARGEQTQKRKMQLVALDTSAGEEGDVSYDPPDPSLPPEAALLRREEERQLHALLQSLPTKMSWCMQLHFLHDFSYRDIAVLLDISVETVKAHIHRGLQKLRAGGFFT